MAKNDGGPAFPHDGQVNYTGGMSLRDWFAGQAVIGILTARDDHGRVGFCEMTPDEIAEHAGKQADAMLAERGAKP